ncbi:hypothetical protein [Streptomyces chryseus]|uniref:hypothetical protein n=1 Tax=Streptomyces chryseus TaxID=68186 RepID=UPI00110FC60A|nr:hypothetical protein [Streptomyces chryseus]GGX36579.1 hypothetical protein GCM10010353_59610 [Streptomyces chryseus]
MSQYDQETREVYDAVSEAMAEAVRVAVTLAAIAADMIVEAREERIRLELEATERRAQLETERLRAERAAAEPILRAVHQERFWKDPDPRRIGRAWQAASEWAAGDPYAAYTLDVLREQLKDRFGIEVPRWPVEGAELARLVTLGNPDYRRLLEQAREAAEAVPGTSYAVLIRDVRDPYTALYRGEGSCPAGMDPQAFAARQYEAWAAGAGAEQVGDRDAADFVVEMVENTGEPTAGHVPAVLMYGRDAAEALQAENDFHRALLDGTRTGSQDEMLLALTGELDRLEAEEAQRLGRRREYASRLYDVDGTAVELSESDRRRLEGNVEAIDTGLPGLHREQADTALRIAAVAAEMRGEEPAHVYAAARLADNLDHGWWKTASAGEVAGVWEHVDSWNPGQAREEMRTLLREEIERHHGLTVPKDATAETVAGLFGGADVPGPATPLTERSEVLRDQAHDLFERAFDAHAQAVTAEAKAADLNAADQEQVRRSSALLVEQADLDAERGRILIHQATFLEDRTPDVMDQLYSQNTAEAVRTLSAEFEQRWGQQLTPEATQQLARTAEEVFGDPWQVSAAQGSADPGVVSIPGQVLAVVEEAAEQVTAEGDEGAAQRDAERHSQAAEALAGMEDQEAAEAARIAGPSFPRGPEAATETPARTDSKTPAGGAPERSREREQTRSL